MSNTQYLSKRYCCVHKEISYQKCVEGASGMEYRWHYGLPCIGVEAAAMVNQNGEGCAMSGFVVAAKMRKDRFKNEMSVSRFLVKW